MGWNVNQDEFGDYIIVAKYNEKPKPEIYYFDGQDKEFSRTEFVPSHDGLSFLGWIAVTDDDGNVLGYVASYASDCANAQTTPAPKTTPVPTGTSPAGTPIKGTPKTSDEAPVMPLVAVAVAGLASMFVSRRRMAVYAKVPAGRHIKPAEVDEALNARR